MNTLEALATQDKLDAFLAAMPINTMSRDLALRCGMTEADAEKYLRIYVNEMQVTLGLVQGHIQPEIKVLEVGAGLCLFSVFLRTLGCDVTALEPSTGGFDRFETAKQVILEAYSDTGLKVWEFPAQDLSARHERFDLIFSNNVLEHIPDLSGAWAGMCAALKPEGKMLHNCPNYLFPYEPHLGIPVFKWAPQLSAFLFPGIVARNREVWDSLNFITYFDVKRLVRDSKMKVSFKRALLWSALSRIGDDPLFRERHAGGVIAATYTILKKSRLLGVLRYLPPVFATPMIFECTHV